VSTLDEGLLCGFSNRPDINITVDTSAGQVDVVRRPGDGVDTSSVEDPALDLDGLAGVVPDKDVAACISRGKVSTIRRVGEAAEGTTDAIELLSGLEVITSNLVDVDLAVLATDGNLSLVRAESDASGSVADGGGGHGLAAADDVGSGLGGGNDEVTLGARSNAHDRSIGGDGVAVLEAVDRSEADAVIVGTADDGVALDGDGRNLVGVASASDALGNAGGSVPLEDGVLSATSVELAVLGSEGVDALVVTSDHARSGSGVGGIDDGDLTVKVEGHHSLLSPETAKLLIAGGGLGAAKLEACNLGTVGGVHESGSLIGRGGKKGLVIVEPGETIDTTGVETSVSGDLVTGLAVVDVDLLVSTAGGDKVAVRAEADASDHTLVVTHGLLELEGRTLEPVDLEVFTTSGDAEGTCLTDVAGAEGLGVTCDLTDRAAGVGHEDSTETLLTITSNDDTLVVAAPVEIRDRTRKRMALELQRVLLLSGIPHTNCTTHITRGDVVAGGAVLGAGNLTTVSIVHICLKRVLEVTDNDSIAAAVHNVLVLGVIAHENGCTALCLQNRCINVLKSSRHLSIYL